VVYDYEERPITRDVIYEDRPTSRPSSRGVIYDYEDRPVSRPSSRGVVYDYDERPITREVIYEDRPSSRPSSRARVSDNEERLVSKERPSTDRPISTGFFYEEIRGASANKDHVYENMPTARVSSGRLIHDYENTTARPSSRETENSYEFVLTRDAPDSRPYIQGKVLGLDDKNYNLKKIILEATNYNPEQIVPHMTSTTSSSRYTGVYDERSVDESFELIDADNRPSSSREAFRASLYDNSSIQRPSIFDMNFTTAPDTNQNLKKVVLEATDYTYGPVAAPRSPQQNSTHDTTAAQGQTQPDKYFTSSSSSFSRPSIYRDERIISAEAPMNNNNNPNYASDNHTFTSSSSSNFQPASSSSYRAERIYIDSPRDFEFNTNKERTSTPNASVLASSKGGSNTENLKRIVLEASDFNPTFVLPSDNDEYCDENEKTIQQEPSSSLMSALAALTQMTALGGGGNESSQVDEVDLRFQGEYHEWNRIDERLTTDTHSLVLFDCSYLTHTSKTYTRTLTHRD